MSYNFVKTLQKCFSIVCVTLTLNGLVVICVSCYATAASVTTASVGRQLTLPFAASVALGALVSIIGVAGLMRDEPSSHTERSFKLYITSAIIGITMSFYVLSAVPNDAETVRTALTTGIERLFDETAASKSKFDEALGVQVALGCCGARNVTDWLKFPTLHERFPKETCCVDPRNCQAPDAVLLNDASIISKHYRKDCVTAVLDDVMPRLFPAIDVLFGIVSLVLSSLSVAVALSLALVMGVRKNTVSTLEWPKHFLNQLVY